MNTQESFTAETSDSFLVIYGSFPTSNGMYGYQYVVWRDGLPLKNPELFAHEAIKSNILAPLGSSRYERLRVFAGSGTPLRETA